MNAEEFYRKVADILGAHHTQAPAWTGSTRRRWDRRLGSGRFPGHGIVRFFSATEIHVALRHPPVTGSFETPEAALKAIRVGELEEILGGPGCSSGVSYLSGSSLSSVAPKPKARASGAS